MLHRNKLIVANRMLKKIPWKSTVTTKEIIYCRLFSLPFYILSFVYKKTPLALPIAFIQIESVYTFIAFTVIRDGLHASTWAHKDVYSFVENLRPCREQYKLCDEFSSCRSSLESDNNFKRVITFWWNVSCFAIVNTRNN